MTEEETTRFPTWENSWTSEQARKITAYFLHDTRDLSSPCLISTSKGRSWLADWWKKTMQSYEEAMNDERKGVFETGRKPSVSNTPLKEEEKHE